MGKKILIIEDETDIVELLQKRLTQEGHEVIVESNGEKGLERMEEAKPDCVVLDLVMSGMGGFEVLEQMAKKKTLKKIPVIVISNAGKKAELDRAKSLGAKGWIVKIEFDLQKATNSITQQVSV